MAAKKFLRLVSGKISQAVGVVVSAGAGNDGDIVALDSTGKFDVSVLPVGVGPDTKSIVAFENIGAGEYVNIFDDAGTLKIRKADNSNGREAHGFLLTAVTAAASGTVYFEGENTALSGLSLGIRYFLDTAGGVTSTPPTSGGGATISQFVGMSVSVTGINTDIDDCIGLV